MANDTKQGTHVNGTPDGTSGESIDQVRDLLFGAQMRTFDAQIQNLTERMLKENATLRSDFDRRVAELQESLDRTAADVRAKKLDSTTLANGLSELAKKLGEQR